MDDQHGTLPGFTAESSLGGAAGGPFASLPTRRARSASAASVTAALIVKRTHRCFVMCEDWRNGQPVGQCTMICL